MRLVIGILLLMFVGLQYRLWLGSGGIEELVTIKRQLQEQKQSNAELVARNERLVYEIKDLKGGLDAIEVRARREFGMIKSNETFYLVIDD